MDDIHLLRTVVEDGSCVEVTLFAYAMATAQQLGTLLDSALYLFGDALQGASLYQWTHIDALIGTNIAYLYLRHLLNENLGKGFLHLFLYIDALGIVTNLSVVTDTTVDDPLSSALQVGILADDSRGLTTQFQTDLRDILRGSCHDAGTSAYRTCDADDVDLGRACHLVTNHAALTSYDIDDTCGQTCLGYDLGKLGTVLWREL